MPLISAPSGEELAKNRGPFKLLPEDEYVLEVKEIEVQKDQKNPYKPDEPGRDTWLVRFRVISFSNGDPLVYDDGSEPDGEARLTGFVDPTRFGLVPRASLFRKFATSAMGTPLDGPILIESFDDLIGKRLIGRVEHRKDREGNKRDRLVDFRPQRTRPARRKAEEDPATAAESLIAVNKDEAEARARDIFGEEAGF